MPTTTVAPLADLAPCPTEALDNAEGPIDVVFWHAMANELETPLIALTDAYNASQDRVRVELQNQTGYESLIDKYINAGQASRPTMVQFPEYMVRSISDSGTTVPAEACLESSGFDTSAFVPRTLTAYQFEGIQRGMPFNVSNPVLYYNRKIFEAAGLDPDDPPVSLEELRAASEQIVSSGAAPVALVLDSGPDSGGGWFLEQWFGRAGEPFADNGNGRTAPATEVFFDNELGVELTTFLQKMIDDGLAMTVGDNPGGQDSLFKLADPIAPGAMTMATSAALGSVIVALGGGLVPDVGAAGHRRRSDARPWRDAAGPGGWCLVVDRGRQVAGGDRRGVGLHLVPAAGPNRSRSGLRRRATCRCAPMPSTSSPSQRRTQPTRDSPSRTISCCRGSTTTRPTPRSSGRSARSAPRRRGRWRRSSTAPTRRPR